jgi:cytochrome o ubiquinol oxidase subunit 1
MAVLGLVGMIGSFILRSNDDDVDYYVPAHEVHETESAYFQRIGSQA